MTARTLVALILMATSLTPVKGKSIMSKSRVELVDGGYSNVVVALDNRLPEDAGLIQAVKTMFQDASNYLYRATRNRVYFKSVTIFIPSNWTKKSDYGSPGSLSTDYADVIVRQTRTKSSLGLEPYTLQIQGCGNPGSTIFFMDRFLTDRNAVRSANLGRLLVREWGHYRWGLFNEYPDPQGDPDHVTYFYQAADDGRWKPVSCSMEYDIRPVIVQERRGRRSLRICEGNEELGYEEGCIGLPRASGGASGSIMFGQITFPDIVNFCDNTSDPGNLHNREAINKHNRLCDSKSNWEVMREHEDFKDGRSPPTNLNMDELMPRFNLVQFGKADECRLVLVLDTSGSMQDHSRIDKVISASTAFTNLVKNGAWVGIVSFSGSSSVLQPMIKVNSDADRETLRAALRLSAAGSTCIGCGLSEGLEVLRQQSSGSVAGGILLLMTDGRDDSIINHPIRSRLQHEGVRVDTLAIGQSTSGEIGGIADETGGTSHFYADDSQSAGIIDALTETVSHCRHTRYQTRVQLSSERYELEIDESKTGSVLFDPSVGVGTQFIVTYIHDHSPGVSVTVRYPDNTTVTRGSPEYRDGMQRTIVISIPQIAMSGRWFYTIHNLYPGTQSATMSVFSLPVSEDEDSIGIESRVDVSALGQNGGLNPLVAYAQLRKGFRPVIDANVKAIIDRPNGPPLEVELFDNGAGADISAFDGVYSRFFTEYTGEGFYGVRIVAENEGKAKILDHPPRSSAPPQIDIAAETGEILSDASLLDNYSGGFLDNDGVHMIEYEPIAPFSRGSSAGSAHIPVVPPSFVAGQDLFPPNRIQDLRVRKVSIGTLTLILTWTAPGDDLDSGAASSYDIRMSHSTILLASNFENAQRIQQSSVLQGDLSAPKPFGSLEEYTIRVPDIPDSNSFTYALAVRAQDDAGSMSPVSNRAVAHFMRTSPVTQSMRSSAVSHDNACGDMACENGGTLQEEFCSCSCLDSFQGLLCQHEKSQLRIGVEIYFLANITECVNMVGTLREVTAEQLTIYCNGYFGICCPVQADQGPAPYVISVVEYAYASPDDIRIADGYPMSGESVSDHQSEGCYMVVIAIRPEAPELCEVGPGLSRRRKRSSTGNYPHHHRQKRQSYQESSHIPQEVLLEVLTESKEVIESRLQVTIGNIKAPEVQDESPQPGKGMPGYAVALIIVILLIVCGGVLALIYVYNVKKRQATPPPSPENV